MLGSSEFNHGKKSEYHPTAIFRNLGMNVMCIGQAANQSLSHAITLGSVSNQLEQKKVVLILSPSWFSKNGLTGSNLSARFSESQYEAFLKNDNISEETKKAVSERVIKLLSVSPSIQEQTKLITKMYLTKDATLEEKIKYATNKWINEEKENINIGLLWKYSGGKNFSTYVKPKAGTAPDWDALAEKADSWLDTNMTNQFYIKDNLYNREIVPVLQERKDDDKTRSYYPSPEYDDLRLFLDVCKQENLEVMLVMLPVNGWWYDYTGFSEENRQTFVTNVQAIADEYGAKTCNFFDESYTPGFLEDIVHPAGKGWTRINEAVYKFYTEN
jgi:D-alanine transfer protein